MGNQSDPGKTICLVGCGKQKAPGRARAKDIYTSPFFQYKRQYAERFGESWFIISAKHHLLHPDKVIEPYDEALNGAGVTTKKSWATIVYEQLYQVISPNDTIVILAGKDYFEYLLPLLGCYKVLLPLKRLKQGGQMQWLKSELSNEDNDAHK